MKCLTLLFGAALGIALHAHPADAQATQPEHRQQQSVEVTEGEGTMTLDNGSVTVMLDTDRGRVASMKLGDQELLGNGGWAGVQFYARGSPDAVQQPSNEMVVQQQTDEVVDVGFHQWRKGFILEMHYVVRAGDPGFYNYIVMHNNPELNPGNVMLEQINLLVRADPEIFNYATIGPEKSGPLPSPQQMRAGDQIMDATYLLEDGTVDAKYDWTLEEDGSRAFGLMGDDVGLFIIKDSGESLNGAPVARELTVHATTLTPVLLRHFVAGHYGRGKIHLSEADGKWSKIAGPWFVYATEGESHEQMWEEAEARAEQATAEWPYTWMEHPLYVEERGVVTGKIKITNGIAQDALVVLAPPPTEEEPNWRTAGKGYFFWTHADQDGSFEIRKVRPGEYALYVVQDEQFGQHRVDGVTVAADQTTDVGTIEWTPEVRGEVVWQIGRPDGTSGEFRNGDDYRHWGLWLRYPEQFPDDVSYVVGESEEREDWNYVQPAIELPDGSWRLPNWDVRFNMDEQPRGTAYLRIAVASVSAHATPPGGEDRWAGFEVSLNGEPLETFQFPHDSGITRSANRGNYHEVLLPIDASKLKAGENVLSLQLASNPPTEIGKNFPYCSVAYDALRLELDQGDERDE